MSVGWSCPGAYAGRSCVSPHLGECRTAGMPRPRPLNTRSEAGQLPAGEANEKNRRNRE